jgi:hypothetical protein
MFGELSSGLLELGWRIGDIEMNLNVCRIGLLPLLLGAVACSDMNPGDETFSTVFPNLAGGGSGGDGPSGNAGTSGAGGTENEMPLDQDDWGCLSTGITMPQMPRARITYQVGIVDFDSQPVAPTPVPQLNVEVCSNVTCDTVLPACDTTSGDPMPTQQCAIVAQGPLPFVYLINLPWGLDAGGLKMTAPGYVQMHYLFGGPMFGTPEGSQVVVGLTIPLLRQEVRQRVYRQVRLNEVDPARGSIAVRTLTCARLPDPLPAMAPPPQGQRARGILVTPEQELPEPAVSWSLSNGNQFTNDVLLTDARGVAGVLNVIPQSIKLNAILPNGEEYSSTTLPVVADVITLAELRPGLEQWGQ